jgi:Domain of unknown function (DUF4349)
MKVIPFPKPGDEHDEQAFAAQLEAAMRGEGGGEAADYWRELRADVRSLAPTISPEFERELRERLAQRAGGAASPDRPSRRRSAAFARARAWLGIARHRRVVAGAAICVLAAIVTLVIVVPLESGLPTASEHLKEGVVLDARGSSGESSSSSGAVRQQSGRVRSQLAPLSASKSDSSRAAAGESAQALPSVVAAPTESAAPPARVQQRAATLTLAPKPAEVQSVADRIAQLAARDGGFVQSSQVHLQRGAGGEASLQLSVPSARLSAALAELTRLAPTRAQSQSLQDITDEYSAARSKLADAVAERQALLRALAKASTQGEIESLHARLSLAGAAIARARSAFQSVSKRGSNSAVEVTVLGDAHASGGRSTLSKALHDAGDVLKVALAVLIVALAVLVPLALLAAIVAIAWRVSRRRLRERALS